jgi:PAS domain S-box-containing protein
MNKIIHILHLEDDVADMELVQATLESAGIVCQINCVQTREEFSETVSKGGYDVILADYGLPMYDGMSALQLVKELQLDVPFIFVSGTMGEDAAIEGLTEGATDYVLKQKLSRLAPALRRALLEAENKRERKQAEEELHRLNRELRAISRCNEVLVREQNEQALLNDICCIICDEAGYRLAWVGYVEYDNEKTVRPVAWSGFDDGYVANAKLSWADNAERAQGPGGAAIRSGETVYIQDFTTDPRMAPWQKSALQRGYRSAIALPLKDENANVFGVLLIYSMEINSFTLYEIRILEELASDMAFGITALRMRVERDQTEVELRESEERYRLITENTADTIAVFDLNLNPTYISPAELKLRGYTVQEALTQTLDQRLTPDSLQRAMKMFTDQMALESSGTADPARTALMELEEFCKDGSTIWVELAASFLRDNNFKPTRILTVTRDITKRKQVEERLKETLDRLRKAVETTIHVLVSALESRDPYTAGHQSRSADLARAIAKEMGLSQDKIDGLLMAGSIHDIGKLSIPAEILSKPTKLTEIEFSLIKVHSQSGYEMLKDVESPWPLAEIVYQHHERMNGSGYPRNLKGDEIIIEARIMAVADVVEAMASHRPYRAALGIETALEEIEKNKGIIYDNAVVDACLKLFREKGYQFT